MGGGLWQYKYTVYNNTDPAVYPDINLFDITFTFDPTVAATVLSLPDGWDHIPDAGSIEAFAVNVGAPPIGNEIPPGTSLGGFSIQFDRPVGSIPFTVFFFDPANPENLLQFSGTTTNAVVPEPGAYTLLAGALVPGLVLALRRRRR